MHLTIAASALPYSLTIIDLQGKIVYENDNLADTNHALNISEFETGTYLITVESANGGTGAKKMIKIFCC